MKTFFSKVCLTFEELIDLLSVLFVYLFVFAQTNRFTICNENLVSFEFEA